MRCCSPLFIALVLTGALTAIGSASDVLPARAWQTVPPPPRGLPVTPPTPVRPVPLPLLPPPSLAVPSPRPTTPPPARGRVTTTRTLRAILVSVNAAAQTLQLRDDSATGGGAGTAEARTFTVFADPAAQYSKNNVKTGARLADFAPGEIVVARVTFRDAASASGAATEEVGLLRALWDDVSYEREKRARRDICVGVVASWDRTGSRIEVRRASDGEIAAFRVTAKTVIYQSERAPFAGSAAYPAGAPVAVKPRALPSGDVMASIIAPTEREALAVYGDSLATWAGEAVALDEQAQTLTLHRDDGAVRTVALFSLSIIKRGRAQVMPPRVIIGQNVRVHLEKNAERGGLRVADAVTIPTRKGKKDEINSARR